MSDSAEDNNKIEFRPIGDLAETVDNSSEQIVDQHNDENEESSSNNKISYEAGGAVTVLKSVCMNCYEDGQTRLLLTKIPFFRDVILMAFECPSCGFRNSEVQSASVQEKGCHYEAKITNLRDMNKQLVKSSNATVNFPDIDFDIPPITQSGVLTTVEGVLARAIEDLENSQVVRRNLDPDNYEAIEKFLVKLRALRDGESLPFTITLDDPSGNSFMENRYAPKSDPNMKVRFYRRTPEQNKELGLAAENAFEGAASGLDAVAEEEENETANTADVDTSDMPALADENGCEETGCDCGRDHKENPDLDPNFESPWAGSSAKSVFANTSVDLSLAKEAKERLKQERQAHAENHSQRDLSGNTPGLFQKRGALIKTATERAATTNEAKVRAGVVHDESGDVRAYNFDASASTEEKVVMRFPSQCFHCNAPGEVTMCVTDIPHFKEIILMSFACDECGQKNVEVKGGGAVPDHGTIHELRYSANTTVTTEIDHEKNEEENNDSEIHSRDVIKSDTAGVEIPELELELEAGTLGGMYTTVEGLLVAIRDKFLENDPFSSESLDSADSDRLARMKDLMGGLEKCIKGTMSFTLRMKDPMANTWIYSPWQTVEGEISNLEGEDPFLTIEHYERTQEENDELGISDMNAPRDD